MNHNHNIEAFLAGSLYLSRISSLRELYIEADNAVSEFTGTSGLSCVSGCGVCCERYFPEVTTVEADLIAYSLMLRRTEANSIHSVSGKCPFFLPDRSEHCGIYEVRPLICRLFGFSSDRDRNGEVRFRYCREMKSDGDRSLGMKEVVRKFGAIPPVMGDYGVRLSCLASPDRGVIERIDAAAVKAIERLNLLGTLFQQGDDPDATGKMRFNC